MRVAIMQPYFFPYAGYFRLFSQTDLFIALDNVQFPRRGWVHRNRLLNANREPAWLTLPLARSPRDATIAAQRFAPDAANELRQRLRAFPAWCAASPDPLLEDLVACEGTVLDYLLCAIRGVCARLAITTPVVCASDIPVDPALTGPERLIALAKSVGASTYLNASGGRALYDPDQFARHGLALEFLADCAGSRLSILQTLLDGSTPAVEADPA